MAERIALLEKETKNLKEKLNPNKSKLLDNVVKAKKQHDDLLLDVFVYIISFKKNEIGH